MGGSYPGSLSAYYRLTHPELVVGALASSAPVQAKNAFEEYDGHVTQVVGPVCAAALRKVVAASEAAFAAGGDSFRQFKALFNGEDVLEDRDFLYMLADVTADAVQYGYPEKLCAPLTSGDPVRAYAKYVRDFLIGRGETAVSFSPQGSTSLDPKAAGGMRQWYYQSCMEYGYWQDSHSDPSKSVRSSRINADYDLDFCRRLFGITRLADESVMNARYYLPLLQPETTHVFFTNGTIDPWSELSINSVRGNDVNPNTPTVMIQGKAHCSDLRAQTATDPQSLIDARQRFIGLALDWIH
jgi:pimeloyl-ACP methyl ester carboxylesterase